MQAMLKGKELKRKRIYKINQKIWGKKIEQNIEIINEKKKDLEELRNHKMNGCMIRSMAKWLNDGKYKQ